MSVAVEFPDLELWLCGWLRPRLAEWSPFVSNRLTEHAQRFAVVVRDDSGPDNLTTAQRRVGVRVFGDDPAETSRVARRVAALLHTTPGSEPGNPVAACGEVFGPYRVDTADPAQSEHYLTAELVVVGVPFTA